MATMTYRIMTYRDGKLVRASKKKPPLTSLAIAHDTARALARDNVGRPYIVFSEWDEDNESPLGDFCVGDESTHRRYTSRRDNPPVEAPKKKTSKKKAKKKSKKRQR